MPQPCRWQPALLHHQHPSCPRVLGGALGKVAGQEPGLEAGGPRAGSFAGLHAHLLNWKRWCARKLSVNSRPENRKR